MTEFSVNGLSTVVLVVGDFDQDQDMDVISGNDNGGSNYVYRNDGSGFFDHVNSPFTALNTRALAVGDLDGDGTLDVVEGVRGGPNKIYFNLGGGTFSPTSSIAFGIPNGNTRSLAVGDVDEDGDLDVITGNSNGQANNVYLNDAGVFVLNQSLGDSDTESVALGDLDSDGDLDLVTGNNGAHPNRVYLNHSGTFTESGQSLGSAYSIFVEIGDVDNDLDLDIVVANTGSSQHAPGASNRVYINDGSGTFLDSGQLIGDSHTRSVRLGDLNNDGSPDLVCANDFYQDDYLYLNDGAGLFVASQTSLGSLGFTNSTPLVDLDGDGDLDLLKGNYGQHNSVYLNDTSFCDCDGNGQLDSVDIAGDPGLDCDLDGVLDSCSLLSGAGDCNLNNVYDACEIIDGTVPDCNDNQIPDNCEGLPDCNADGVLDECEEDCDEDGVPDVCEILNGTGTDCDDNGVLDNCDDLRGDCDGDGVFDECELANGEDTDQNGNNIPDSCECIVNNYCSANPNTAGPGVQISATGIPSISLNILGLDATAGPSNQPGLYFHGPGSASQPFGEGLRCVSTPILRVGPPVFFNGAGNASKQLDMNATALSGIQSADTRYFQLWYRDSAGGPWGYNLSDGLEITFCP